MFKPPQEFKYTGTDGKEHSIDLLYPDLTTVLARPGCYSDFYLQPDASVNPELGLDVRLQNRLLERRIAIAKNLIPEMNKQYDAVILRDWRVNKKAEKAIISAIHRLDAMQWKMSTERDFLQRICFSDLFLESYKDFSGIILVFGEARSKKP